MWVPITAQDIVKRFRPLSPEENATIETHIEDATDMLETRLEAAGVDSVQPGERWTREYKRVVASMIIRYLRNPEGLLSEEIVIDDFREVRRRDSVNSTGVIYLSVDELTALLPTDGRRRSRGAFSIRLGTR